MTDAVAVVPAAGRSSRFGGMKLLADVHGEPLLNHTLRSLISAGARRIVVVLSPDASLDAVGLLGHPVVTTVVNPDPTRGMFSSIQAGLSAVDGPVAAVLPADMPFVASETVRAMIETCERTGSVVVPVFRGRRGHPLVLPGRFREALLAMDPGLSLKDALLSVAGASHEVDVDDPGVLRDVDTPADLGDPGSPVS